MRAATGSDWMAEVITSLTFPSFTRFCHGPLFSSRSPLSSLSSRRGPALSPSISSPHRFHAPWHSHRWAAPSLSRSGCPVRSELVGSIPGLFPLDAGGTTSCDNETCPQTSSRDKIIPCLYPLLYMRVLAVSCLGTF